MSAQRLGDLAARPLIVNLGGSVLLGAALPEARRQGADILRVGEAIVTGTIPGTPDDASFFKSVTMDACVVQADGARDGSQRVLVDRGTTSLDPADLSMDGARLAAAPAGREYARLTLHDHPRLKPGDHLRLTLGYRSALRALLNPAMVVRWKRAP